MATGIHMQITQRQQKRRTLMCVGHAFLSVVFRESAARLPNGFLSVKGEPCQPAIRLGYFGAGLRLNAHDWGPPRPFLPRAL